MYKKRRTRNFWLNLDWILLMIAFLICLTGLVVLHSAGFNRTLGKSPAMIRQAGFMGIGFVILLCCRFLKKNFWQSTALPIYIICCVLLLVVDIAGESAKNAQRWLSVGFIRVQPSEFMKFGVILYLSHICASFPPGKDGYKFLDLLKPGIIILIPLALVFKQPDLGTAIIISLIAGTILLVAGINKKLLIMGVLIAGVATIPAWMFVLKDYQKQRVLTFFDPSIDPQGSGYHALQSQIAVGSGGFSGKGFLQGTQTQLRFLPEQHTDFIFSVLAEEWGFLGTSLLICLYGFLLIRLISIAYRAEDLFSVYFCLGVIAMIFWQVFINIGMVIGILPVVGITLPLFSHGGSSVFTVLAALGVVGGLDNSRSESRFR